MNTNSKTSLFLMELIIVILFFSIAAVVCVQLFVNAYTTNNTTQKEAQANLVIQNLAEAFMGCEGDLGAICELYDSNGADYANVADGVFSIGYTEDDTTGSWSAVPSGTDASYTARICVHDADGNIIEDPASSSGQIITADIYVVYDFDPDLKIGSQTVELYIPYRSEASR